MKRYTFFVFLIVIRCINLCRLCLVAVKRFPENIYFPEMLISGKGKWFHAFGCILKNFPENIFWCLEKKKENTNQKTQSHSPGKKIINDHNTRSRSTALERSGSRSRSRSDRDLGSRSRAIDRDLVLWSLMIFFPGLWLCVFWFVFSFFFSKHQKIFFEKFFEMQPNTWKHFPFPENMYFPENILQQPNTALILHLSIDY